MPVRTPGTPSRCAPRTTGRSRCTSSSGFAAQDTVVAYVKNHRSDELRLMVGEREVVVHDRDLVTRILNAAGGN